MTRFAAQLVARLTCIRGHERRHWFAGVERTHTTGLADFMSKIFNE
ncbi:MAG TPA: hypothetical protein VNT79_05930 [Phycisphaerae bacterium]|nr:hypothetical protein [Phycisphaerae bacterium]